MIGYIQNSKSQFLPYRTIFDSKRALLVPLIHGFLMTSVRRRVGEQSKREPDSHNMNFGRLMAGRLICVRSLERRLSVDRPSTEENRMERRTTMDETARREFKYIGIFHVWLSEELKMEICGRSCRLASGAKPWAL